MAGKWSAAETQQLISMVRDNKSVPDIADSMQRSNESVRNKIKRLQEAGGLQLRSVAWVVASNPRPPDEVMRLKEELRHMQVANDLLLHQLTWAQEAKSPTRTGGTLSIRRADDHHCDKNHLLGCAQSLTEKLLDVIGQYQPDRIQIVGFDDWLCGSGIYREQDLDVVLLKQEEQIAVGAMKAIKFIQAIRGVTDAPIQIQHLRGNHEFSRGQSMTEALHDRIRILCEDIPDLTATLWQDRAVINLAHDGEYLVLVRHGHGYSEHSPNSPKFINTIKDEILVIQNRRDSPGPIRRVISGHTHWLSCGVERVPGLFFDTVGGLLRNVRVRLGDNQRPIGWLVYVSPPGLENEILLPILLRPKQEIYEWEIADPDLPFANMRDAADCLQECRNLEESKGYREDSSLGKVNEGR